ncbi:protealysin inhibitor emfourin [Arthrobacter mangrovi]|uniref:Uncharacterized protein n=1 Tax=Arthrobacter mangrovi TaxID=2966350 RepID=A0ABQ5MYX3_9MICC|nr:protealysin inhibitor emfourin [Arthrobacter mangrovi]GLB69185.1 hypothetical protein AHIS1636_36280 [Arthrobacter mangrovi]
MRIDVRRTGGFAGLTTQWAVDVAQPELGDVWMPLIDSCPWDDVPDDANEPDRYVYSISAGEREVTLPEHHLTGPWRALVDRTRDAARTGGLGEAGALGETAGGFEAAGSGPQPPVGRDDDVDDDVLEPDRPVTDPSRWATEPGQRLFPPPADGPVEDGR